MEEPRGAGERKGVGSSLGIGLGIGVAILVIILGIRNCDGSFETRPAESITSTAREPTRAVAVREPAYVKDVAAYEEGTDAMVVYFVVADSDGSEVRAEGRVTVSVYESYMSTSTYKMQDRKLWANYYTVTTSSFQKAEVGLGGFAHTRLLCSLGRIEYARFTTWPTEFSGKVEVIFTTPSGKQLRGETTYIF